jgi:hypothetical protein
LYGVYIDIGIARLGGSLTYEGILGNLDGNRQNDIQIRGGDLITPPASLDQLKSFGDSWRLSEDESLFRDPLSTNDTAESAGPLTISDLDPNDRAEAQDACEGAGVTDPLALHNCTYDVTVTGDETFIESAQTFQEDTEDVPEEFFVAAVPSQGLPVASPAAALEIGQQYAVGDVPGTFRYFQLTQLPDENESRATLELCPDLQSVGLVNIADIMTEEEALEKGLTATNEPCVEAEVVVAEVTETAPTAEPAVEIEATAEPTKTGTTGPGGGLCNAPMVMPLFVGLGLLTVKRRRLR